MTPKTLTLEEAIEKHLPLSYEAEAKVKQRLWDVLTDQQKLQIGFYNGGVESLSDPSKLDDIRWEVNIVHGMSPNPNMKAPRL